MNNLDTKRLMQALTACAIAAVASTGSAAAQGQPAPAIELSAGALMFADDGIVSEGGFGVASRFYISRRLSVGPEIVYVSGEHHSHLILTGNATVDLIRSPNGARRLTPFLVVGGGIFRTRERFPNNSVFTHAEGAFTAGGGIRARSGEHLLLGAEARVGWELHFRINGIVGIQFGN